MLKDLMARRVPHILGLYLAAGWGVLEFTDWVVNRYVLSPHFTDLALVAWALMIPTVLMLAYFHGRPGRDEWATLEKIGIPINILLALLVLYTAFSGKELGAATTEITVVDEEGREVERVVPKEAFRKRFALFYFDNESGDTALDWLQFAIPLAMQDDLLQDMFIDVRSNILFNERLEEAGYPEGIDLPLTLRRELAEELHLAHFVSGTLQGSADSLQLEVSLYDVDRGKLIKERSYTGANLFELADNASLQLRRDLEIPEQHIEESRDLPVAEMLTGSTEAFRHLVDGWRALESERWQESATSLEAAINEDPRFSYANLLLFQVSILRGDSERAKLAIESAMEHSYKLPERYQFAMKAAYYRVVKQDIEKTLAVAGTHAELFPEDIAAHSLLLLLHNSRGEHEKAIAAAQRILELDPGEHEVLRVLGALHEQVGDLDAAVDYYEQYADRAPGNPQAFNDLGDVSRLKGDHARAKEYYERVLVLEPGDTEALIDLARTATAIGDFQSAEANLAEALDAAATPSQTFQVQAARQAYSQRRGRIGEAVENMERAWAAAERALPPLGTFQRKLDDVTLYVTAGRTDTARALLAEIRSQLSPPLDLFLALGELELAIELENPADLELALVAMDSLISGLGLEIFMPRAVYGRGRLLELRGELEEAIVAYERALELRPSHFGWQLDIGRCYRRLGQYDKAIDHLQRGLNVEPYAPRTNLELARVYKEMGRDREAAEHLDRALKTWENADSSYEPAREARALRSELKV